MTTVYLSPIGNGVAFLLANGTPNNGGFINTYQAGTSTPCPTYTTSAGSIQNANPIVLGVDGKVANEIWLTAGQAYKFIITDSAGNPIGPTLDNLYGINDPVLDPAIPTPSEWILYGGTPSYLSGTSFSVTGNQVAIFNPMRRIQASISTGTLVYGTISTSVYAGGITTVTMTMDGASLDSGLTAVYYGILSALHSSYPVVVGEAPFVISTGTADAILATIVTTATTLTNGFQLELQVIYPNATTTPTLDLILGSTDTGAFPIVKYNNLPLVAGDITGGCLCQFRWATAYNAWILINPAFGPIYPWSVTGQALVYHSGTTLTVPPGFGFKVTVQGGGSGSSQVPGNGALSSISFNSVTVIAGGGVTGAGYGSQAVASGGDLNISGGIGSTTGSSGGLMGQLPTPTGYGFGGSMNAGANFQSQGSSGATAVKYFTAISTSQVMTIVVGGGGGNGGQGIVIVEF